jgi:two-component system, NarL family, invasion response regulator UvrY
VSRGYIRVAVVDDHAIVRTSLQQLLTAEGDMRVVAQAGTGREAIDIVRQHALDVLILDLAMPGQSGMEVLPVIRAKAPEVGILVLSGYPEEQYALMLIRQGAQGYLGKDCDPREIVRAVRVIAAGRRYFSPRVSQVLAEQVDAPAGLPHRQLRDREIQVLLRLAKGQTTRQVARDLCLSPKTVGHYRASMLEKLGLHSAGEVTHYALKNGLIE